MAFTRAEIERMAESVRNVIREVASGKRYRDFSYQNAFEAVRYNYHKAWYKAPFVVVCENPLEQQVIANAMRILWNNQDGKFLSLFDEAKVEAQREEVDIEKLELLSKAVFQYALAEVHRIINLTEKGLIDVLCRSHSAYYDRLCYYSDFYFIWLEGLEKKLENLKNAFPTYRNLRKVNRAKQQLTKAIPFSTEVRKQYQEHQKKSGIFSIIPFENVAIISKYPKYVCIDFDTFRLHSVRGPAIEFGHSDPLFELKYYYVRGRQIRDTWIFENFTLEQFIYTPNEETRAAMYEILLRRGTDEMLSFLQAEEVDRVRIEHNVKVPVVDSDGHIVDFREEVQEEEIVLYRTKQGIPTLVDPITRQHTAKLAWLSFRCPSTGANFLISTSPSFNSALEAAKHSRAFDMQTDYRWTQRT